MEEQKFQELQDTELKSSEQASLSPAIDTSSKLSPKAIQKKIFQPTNLSIAIFVLASSLPFLLKPELAIPLPVITMELALVLWIMYIRQMHKQFTMAVENNSYITEAMHACFPALFVMSLVATYMLIAIPNSITKAFSMLLFCAVGVLCLLYCVQSLDECWNISKINLRNKFTALFLALPLIVLPFCLIAFFVGKVIFAIALAMITLLVGLLAGVLTSKKGAIETESEIPPAHLELEEFIDALVQFENTDPANAHTLQKLVEQKQKNSPTETNYAVLESSYKQDLQDNVNSIGYCHPEIAASLNHMGWFYYEQQKYDVAESIYQKALYILEQTNGLNTKLGKSIQSNYQRLQIATGQVVKVQIKPKDL